IDIPDPGQLSKSPGVRVWDVTTGRPMGEGKVSLGGNLKVALSAANSNAVLVSDARTGQPVCPPLVHPAQVTSFAFSPDGTFVLTVCADATNAPGAAYLWETKSGRGIAKMAMPLGKDVHTVGFSPDGRRLITESGSIRLWHSSNGHPAAVFSPDGQARLWDASNVTWLGTIAKRALPSSVVS